MAKNDYDPMSLISASLKAAMYQRRTDSLSLIFRQDGHWSKSQSRDCSRLGDDRQVAEKDVADDLTISYCNQRAADIAAITQSIDEATLVVLTEGETIDVTNR